MDKLTGELDYPMLIVTTTARGERAGCLVGFHTQCSIDPERWAVWISKANHTYGVAVDSTTIAVHFPSADDHDLAELFGSETEDEIDKFTRTEWRDGPHGVPLLTRCPNRFVGRVMDTIDNGGDHVCFVLDPLASWEQQIPFRALTFQAVRDLEPGHPA
jgi:flavin reductase (DIM6/NTAB) family NADH-FMN oxidoreductase RutF